MCQNYQNLFLRTVKSFKTCSKFFKNCLKLQKILFGLFLKTINSIKHSRTGKSPFEARKSYEFHLNFCCLFACGLLFILLPNKTQQTKISSKQFTPSFHVCSHWNDLYDWKAHWSLLYALREKLHPSLSQHHIFIFLFCRSQQ